MSTDQDHRVRAALQRLADAVPVTPPPAAALRARTAGRQPRTGRRWLAPVLAATAVLTLVAAAALVPGWLVPPAPPAAGAERPVLPERFAGLSWRTASVADSPPGTAIAVFTMQNSWPPVHVVVGADGRTYRQLDRDARRELSHGRETSTHGPTLSPDGTRLAGDGGYVIDLTGGGVSGSFPVLATDTEEAWGAAPFLAWSADSRWLAYQVPGGIALVDSRTGTTRTLAIGDFQPPVGFAPDGQSFAVTSDGGDRAPDLVVIYSLAGDQLRELELPPAHYLVGHGTGWSPDGALLVTYGPGPAGDGYHFLDATGTGAEVPAPIAWPVMAQLLGWRSPTTMLVQQQPAANGMPTTIVAVPVAGGEPRVVSRFADDPQRSLATLQLATGLLAEAEVRDPGSAEHGPLPAGRLIAWAVAGGALVLLAGLVVWWSRRRAGAARRPR